jgi:hypothetical protein
VIHVEMFGSTTIPDEGEQHSNHHECGAIFTGAFACMVSGIQWQVLQGGVVETTSHLNTLASQNKPPM